MRNQLEGHSMLDANGVIDEKLKNIDPNMVKLITNEVIITFLRNQ